MDITCMNALQKHATSLDLSFRKLSPLFSPRTETLAQHRLANRMYEATDTDPSQSSYTAQNLNWEPAPRLGLTLQTLSLEDKRSKVINSLPVDGIDQQTMEKLIDDPFLWFA